MGLHRTQARRRVNIFYKYTEKLFAILLLLVLSGIMGYSIHAFLYYSGLTE